MRGATEVVSQAASPTFLANTMPPTHRATSAKARPLRLGLVQVVLENLDHLLHDLLVGGLHRLPAALDVGGHPDQRAAAVAIVEVLA